MPRLLITVTSLLIAACAASPQKPAAESLFADHLFAASTREQGTTDAVFALSAEMRSYLNGSIAARVRRKGPRVGLMEILRDELRIEYDSALTRTAAEAFAARSGNCLSLAVLTAAFAKELKIPLTYQSIYGQDTWTRNSGIAFRSSHVNLVLGTRGSGHWLKEPDRPMTVDFLPSDAVARLHARAISEETVLGMFYNNRAAETLAAGDTDRAYGWARQAIRTAPQFVSAYNTLGVIYRRRGHPLEAERALRHALGREPGNAQVLSNLVGAVAAQGRSAEAQRLRQQLAAIVAHPPFHYADLGRSALLRGETESAITLFEKELARMPYDDELHFMLALAQLRQGELRDARKHVALALANSPTRERRGIYAAKLDRLRALSVN